MTVKGSEAEHSDADAHNRLQVPANRDGLPVHAADALLAGGTMALIVHGNQTYCLRKTRLGKLILYK